MYSDLSGRDREFTTLIRGLISESKYYSGGASWDADCVRESKEKLHPTLGSMNEMGYSRFRERGKIYIPETVYITIQSPREWRSPKILEEIRSMVPTGGVDGYKTNTSINTDFGIVSIYCDVYTDVYRLLLSEGILTDTYPSFGLKDDSVCVGDMCFNEYIDVVFMEGEEE